MGSELHGAPGKRALVVYYSLTGNTARVAHDIAARIGADVESLRDPAHGTGLIGFIKACVNALRGVSATLGPLRHIASTYDLVVIGTPVWAGRMTPAARAYLRATQGKLARVAFFITSGNTDVGRMLPALESAAGTKASASTGFSAQDLKDSAIYQQKLDMFVISLGLPHSARKPSAPGTGTASQSGGNGFARAV